MNSLPTTIEIKEDILVQELDNSTVILNLNTEHYYGLDEVGQRIWQLFSEQHDSQTVLSKLIDEYDVDPAILEADMISLINEMSEANLISVS